MYHSSTILADAKKEDIESLTKFADHMGLIFQIGDDILDKTGTKKELGKNPHKDQQQNKLTYLSFGGIEKAKQYLESEYLKAQNELLKLSHLDTPLLQEFLTNIKNRTH